MSFDKNLFEEIKNKILNLDPVYFIENNLTLDGNPFRLTGNGYKPFVDIYRYIGIKALEKDSKPVVLVKGRQVGGTTMASALEMFFMGCGTFGVGGKPPMRVMHLFPIMEMAAQYSKAKLNPMINSSVIDSEEAKLAKGAKVKSYMQKKIDQNSGTADSLSFKQFVNDNFLMVDSTGLDGDRIRGRTADIIFFDECQDLSESAISNTTKTLAKSHYGKTGKGVQVYFGTPKKKGSTFCKLWEASNQQYYHLGCQECKGFFPLYTPGSDDWEKTWLYGFVVKCPHCGCEQNKDEASERGKWVGTKNSDDCEYIGFHINQLYMPGFSKETIISEKPGIHPVNGERVYQNEVLGEFFNGDSSPMTMEEVHTLCGDKGRRMTSIITPSDDKLVFVGVDFGERNDIEQMNNTNKTKVAGKSYSTAVVLTAAGPNLLSIEFATKFKKNDLTSKKEILEGIMRQYSANLVIGDIGYSNDFSTEFQMVHGNRYLVSRAIGNITNPNKVKYQEEMVPKELQFERDHFIGELFALMKKGQVRFPYGDYDKISWLVAHCSSMDIKPSISRFGDHKIHYVKGSTPNDGFMALLNAYLAYKFYITKGFTINNPLTIEKNIENKKKPLAVLGHIKRRM